MAVFSAIKNKKNKKLREGIEDLATRCSLEEDPNIQVEMLIKQLETMDMKLTEKEKSKIDKLSDDQGKIARDDFVTYAKTCGSVKDYVDKIDREHHQSTSRPVTANLDKASAAFKAIDKDNSGYVDREEFLQFTKNLPAHQQEKLLKKIDKDGDGKISLKEFRQLFEKH